MTDTTTKRKRRPRQLRLDDLSVGTKVFYRDDTTDEPLPGVIIALVPTERFAGLVDHELATVDPWVTMVVSGRTKRRGITNTRLAVGQHVAVQLSNLTVMQ